MERLRDLECEQGGIYLAHTQQTWSTQQKQETKQEHLDRGSVHNGDVSIRQDNNIGNVENEEVDGTDKKVLGRMGKNNNYPRTKNKRKISRRHNMTHSKSILIIPRVNKSGSKSESNHPASEEVPEKRSLVSTKIPVPTLNVAIHTSQEPSTSGYKPTVKRTDGRLQKGNSIPNDLTKYVHHRKLLSQLKITRLKTNENDLENAIDDHSISMLLNETMADGNQTKEEKEQAEDVESGVENDDVDFYLSQVNSQSKLVKQSKSSSHHVSYNTLSKLSKFSFNSDNRNKQTVDTNIIKCTVDSAKVNIGKVDSTKATRDVSVNKSISSMFSGTSGELDEEDFLLDL